MADKIPIPRKPPYRSDQDGHRIYDANSQKHLKSKSASHDEWDLPPHDSPRRGQLAKIHFGCIE